MSVIIFSSASAFEPVTLAPNRQSSLKSVIIYQQLSAPEFATAYTSPWCPVTAHLRKHLVGQVAKSAKLKGAFIACDSSDLGLKTSLSAADLTEAMHRFQTDTQQNNLSTAPADFTTARATVIFAALRLSTMCTDNGHLGSQMSVLATTINDMRNRLATAQFSIFCKALVSLCDERNRYLGSLRRLVGQSEFLGNDFISILSKTRESRLTVGRNVGLLPTSFRDPLQSVGTFEDVTATPSNGKVFVAFNKHRIGCKSVGRRHSYLFQKIAPLFLSFSSFSAGWVRRAIATTFRNVHHIRHFSSDWCSFFNRAIFVLSGSY